MARVLVTGAAGFLGWRVARELQRRGHGVVGTSRDGGGAPPGVTVEALELGDGGAAAAALVRRLEPDAVIHAAALSSADACARDPDRAQRVNAEATATLARAAAEAGAWLAYTSTDLVFDGTRAPYREEDPRAPLGPYMASKGAGEDEVAAASPDLLVARLALLYGRAVGRGRGFAETLRERIERGEAVPLFTDQFRTPLLAGEAAEILADLLDLRPAGILHVGGPERVSRHEHGLAMARALGLDASLCRPATMADVPGLAPRPADVSLTCERLRRLIGRDALGVEAGCARLAAEAT